MFRLVSWVFFCFGLIGVGYAGMFPYELTLKSIEGEAVPLERFKGKTLLIVNTASACGYTPQYKQLQELFTRYQSQGLVVMGFPCNNFGKQEPGSASEIKAFVEKTYQVTFPLFEKVEVQGEATHPLYQYLLRETAEQGPIGWNFAKFVVSKQGKVLGRFDSSVSPLDGKVTQLIESDLKLR